MKIMCENLNLLCRLNIISCMSVPKNAVLSLLINHTIVLAPALSQESPTSRHCILPIKIDPGVFIKFQWGKTVLLTTIVFDVAKFPILTPLLLLFFELPLPVIGLKMFSLTSSLLKFPNKIFTWHLVKWSKAYSNSSQKLSFESSLLTSVCACPFRKVISRLQPVSTVYFSLSPTNYTPLTTVTTFWCTEKSSL